MENHKSHACSEGNNLQNKAQAPQSNKHRNLLSFYAQAKYSNILYKGVRTGESK